MLIEEMTQRHEKLLRMPDTAGVEGLMNVLNDHGPDGFCAMGLLQQIVCQRGGRDFRNVLVLADSIDFVSVQSGKGDASSKEIMACSNASFAAPTLTGIGQATANLRINVSDGRSKAGGSGTFVPEHARI
jgi:hypothetical protein